MVSIRKSTLVLAAMMVLCSTAALANYLAVTDHVASQVKILDADSGALYQTLNINDQPGIVSNPLNSAFGPGNDLYVQDFGNKRLLKYAKSTGDTWNTNSTVVFNQPGNATAVDFGPLDDGIIYVSYYSFEGGYWDGTSLNTVVNTGYDPRGIGWGPGGYMYFGGMASNIISRLSPPTGPLVDPSIMSIASPSGITAGPDFNQDGVNDIYVTSNIGGAGASYISVLSGVVIPGVENAYLGKFLTGISNTADCVWTPDGQKLFFSDANAGVVYKWQGGVISPFAAGFSYSYGVALSDPFQPGIIPEPGSLLALGSGIFGICGFAIRRRR